MPSNMIETGDYTIINVQHQNLAYLADPNESPITANYEQNDMNEKWKVTHRGNGRYTIKNAGNDVFADAGARAQMGEAVNGRDSSQLWVIRESRIKKQYTIETTDTRVMWGFADGEIGTQVLLASIPTDRRNLWKFEKVAS